MESPTAQALRQTLAILAKSPEPAHLVLPCIAFINSLLTQVLEGEKDAQRNAQGGMAIYDREKETEARNDVASLTG